MKILTFGGSGCGKTTLGKELEKMTDFVHLDSDDYYWEKTQLPFQKKIPLSIRNENLKVDFNRFKKVIVSGSMITWGKEWETSFDLVIFMYLKNNERMKRLKKREIERYGEMLIKNKKTKENSQEFLEWANQYENPNFDGRTLKIHKDWIELFDCKVLRIDGEMKLNYNIKKILSEIKKVQATTAIIHHATGVTES